ncbi:LPS export ABC transporter permease LptF [Phaeovulum sp. NW3]|uniref:LPS export ABC transporter permease LptF n=1 Tax=Phaeovulum sp. NW3 TaxID=2934933 RepID=UPI002020E146|nr:LPS export ABC transporter permease LptF [Phaeovulum sp. NW3]MCL7464841.1 LPS export ABC transporter permease LptF [Phaeovulum sp. NW3]
MTRLDRYILSQLMALFGFFALVLVSVYWVNRAVRLFDQLISDGQSARVVLEFTALTLPYVIRLVLPIAAFAATVYAVNRLAQESELVAMQATGASPWRLARPVAVFGLIVAALMAMLVHVLEPAARARLADRQAQIAENVTARFLSEGSFQHPADGVSIYIREIAPTGELLDLFLSDARQPGTQTIYTAEKALIVRSATGPKLIMLEGMAQTLRASDNRLAVTRFADFTYDIGGLITPTTRERRSWAELPSWRLVAPDAATLALTASTPQAGRVELHDRLAQPLLAPVAALLGVAALMLGSFSRFGVWRQIGIAVVAIIAVQFLSNATEDMIARRATLWPLSYLPALVGAALAGAMLWHAAAPRRMRRSRSRAAEGAA